MISQEEQKRLAGLVLFLLDQGANNAFWTGRAVTLFEISLAAVCQLKPDPGREDIRGILLFDNLENARVSLTGSAKERVTNYLRSLPRYKEGLKASEQNEIVKDNHGYFQMQFTRVVEDIRHISNTALLLMNSDERRTLTKLEKEIVIPLELVFFSRVGSDILKNPRLDFYTRETFVLSASRLDGFLGLLGPASTLRAFDLFSRATKTTLDNLKSYIDITPTVCSDIWTLSLQTQVITAAWNDKSILMKNLAKIKGNTKQESPRL